LFHKVIEQTVSTGNIYKIIQNLQNPQELIMACHLGVYYVDLQFRKYPLPTDPVTYSIDCELALKEER